ncbi:TonB-dependent receptor [Flectobacillus roseus]|uniref:TonB-dependent receptor n=1 Tax=Flectobacillus roseus TaxID=502259 RepID=UPI0024B63A15|nr:TonB-dependent receptor [Flectobacillus roseus]MDI9869288.1 TonB-dependent receptor [Flectobacillus roseus]
MKKLLLLLGLLYSVMCQAQVQIQGKVISSDNQEEIIGANLYLVELRRGNLSQQHGKFYFSDLKKGTYTLQISHIGYKTYTQKIDLHTDTTLHIKLTPSAVSLEEVIVSGSASKTVVKESPIPIAALSKTQWLQSGSTNLVDAISKLPGMSQITTGATLSKPIIRGLGFNRVITMHDGVRQEDNQWGEEHSLHIDEYSIDRYEIIRGAGSLMYGSDGIGGVMSVISILPPENTSLAGNILYNYQTNQGFHGVSSTLAHNQNGLLWQARFSLKDAQNYQNKYDGRVWGSNFNELNFSGIVGVQKKWGYSRLYFSKFGQNINIIDGQRDTQGHFVKAILENGEEKLIPVSPQELEGRTINPSNSQALSNYKLTSNSLFQLGASSLSFTFSYAQNHRREYGNIYKPFEPDLYFFLQNYYYDIRLHLPERNQWETNIGSNGLWQNMDNKGNETLYPNFDLADKGVFIFSKKKWNDLIVSGGLRYDYRQLNIAKLYVDADGKFQTSPNGAIEERFSGLSSSYSNITGSLGLVYKFNSNLSMRSNMARGFRAPSVPELSSNGEHAGTFRYEIGNVNQKSEVSLQTDIGFTWENRQWYVDVSWFRNQIQHYTYSERVQAPNGKDSLINQVPVFRYVQGDALLQGLEATVNFTPVPWLSLNQSYSMVKGINQQATNDSSKYLPFMPPARWISQVKWNKKAWGKYVENVYFLAELEHHQTQNQVLLAYNTETITPAYSLVNLGTGMTWRNKDKKTIASLYINVNNLFDLAYQNHQSRLKYLDTNPTTQRRGVYNIGRNVSIKLVVPIH